MKHYLCPICGKSFTPELGIYQYCQPIAGVPIPCATCSSHNYKLIYVLPLATPSQEDIPNEVPSSS